MPGFVRIANPLTLPLTNGAKFWWSPECETAFTVLNARLAAERILYGIEFVVVSDCNAVLPKLDSKLSFEFTGGGNVDIERSQLGVHADSGTDASTIGCRGRGRRDDVTESQGGRKNPARSARFQGKNSK